MKKLAVAVAVHELLVPPDDVRGLSDREMAPWRCEHDVASTLRAMGHDVRVVGVRDDLAPLREALGREAPDIVFNLLEEFHGVADYDQHVVSYLELMRQPYTGCNPRGLTVTRDKALTKKILTYHRIPTPHFAVFPRSRKVRRPRKLSFPLFVKSVSEHASLGIAQASVVHDDDALAERVAFIHEKVETDAIAEEFIAGRELYVSVLGNRRLQVLPIWEMVFDKMPEGAAHIATARVKWDEAYQKRRGITTGPARALPEGVEARIVRICKRIYRSLNLSGYARMDLRLRDDGRIFVLEANPNPNLVAEEDLAASAGAAGLDYPALLQRILGLGLRYRAPWMDA